MFQFFLFCPNPKNDQVRAKKPILGPNKSEFARLRTARSLYGSLWYLRTYVQVNFMYVQVIFEGSHPTLKLTKQKMSEIIQVNVPNFFYFDEIPKMTKLGPKNRFWDLKI